MAKQIPCGQQGCDWLFLQNGDHTKHIHNYHLSRFNIQPIIIAHLQPPAPPLRQLKSNSPPPQDVHTHENSPPVSPNPPQSPNNGPNNASDQDDSFHQPDQPDITPFSQLWWTSPCQWNPLVSEPQQPPLPSQSPWSPSSSSGNPRVPPGMSCIFHATINGKSSSVSFFIDFWITLTGIPCNEHGDPIPVGTPPLCQDADNSPNDWFPYTSQVEFELCDLIYQRSEMPVDQIDDLLNIIAAMQALSSGETTFTTHKDLC